MNEFCWRRLMIDKLKDHNPVRVGIFAGVEQCAWQTQARTYQGIEFPSCYSVQSLHVSRPPKLRSCQIFS